MEFVNCFTPVRFQKKSILPEKKCVNRKILGQKLGIENVLLIYFEQIARFCVQLFTQIQTHSSCFLKTL